MKNNICPLCESKEYKTIIKYDDNNIVKCDKCCFVFVNIINKEFIYKESYFNIENSERKNKIGYRSYEKDYLCHKYYFSKKIESIKKYVAKGKVLDIGCALGFFLETLKENKFSPYGIDISPYAIKYASKKFKTKVFCSTLEKAKFPKNFFDAAAVFQTIEHVKNPINFLKVINNILKPKGTLVITTPNHNSLLQKILKNKWFEYKPEEHFNYFDNHTIELALKKTGFKLINIDNDTFYYPLSYIFERFSYYYSIPNIKLPKILSGIRIPLPLGGMAVFAQKI